jgi:uracil-DNA glycosylase family 4
VASEVEPKRRKIIRDLNAEAKKAPARRAHLEMALSLYPLDAPGMSMPGPDFLEQARNEGDTSEVSAVKVKDEETGKSKTIKSLRPDEILTELHRKALRHVGFSMPVTVKPGLRKVVTFVPGHIWGQHMTSYVQGDNFAVDGPRPAEVMVLGKMPGRQEVQDGRNLAGESGKLLIEILRQFHVQNTSHWYITNLCKFQPPDGSGNLKQSWIADCRPLLEQELRIVRPRYILCLGSDASKALLGTKFTVTHMEGRVMELTYPVHQEHTDDKDVELYHTALVMTVTHPAAVDRDPTLRRVLERGIARFKLLSEGVRFDKEETDIDHRAIHTYEELKALLWEIDNDPDWKAKPLYERWMAFDAEWHGEHPVNKGSYVRTIQFSWKPKSAAAIILSEAGTGKWCFNDEEGRPAKKRMVDLLNRWIKTRHIRACGHFLVADLEWTDSLGITAIKDAFKVPLYDKPFEAFRSDEKALFLQRGFMEGEVIPAWARTYVEGGWDTGLAGHAVEETAMLGLEMLTLRYTACPRYDIPLNEWKEAFCKEHGLKAKDLEGYGHCPDEVLVPYGNYDADGTLRLAYEQMPLVDDDYDHNNCRESFWESMITTMPILEMHQTGIVLDKKLIDEHTKNFMAARDRVKQQIREWTQWPEFNIRSVQQVREFLFGERYNGKRDKMNNIVRIRPPQAKTLLLEPLMDTSKPPMAWSVVRDKGLENERNAGTGKTILGVLAQENSARWQHGDDKINPVQWIRDYRFVDQALKSILRPPVTDDEGNWVYEGDEGYGDELGGFGGSGMGGLLYDAGLASVICDDGRVRTHLYPTTETKRWRSARPNLQNISKRRDPDYERILGKELYRRKLRSIFVPSPGCVLVEADFTGAELYGMAIMAGDKSMIDHCRRNALPEDDPDFYDIHSNVAVLAFKLQCEPTKKGLKAIGKAQLRIAAKTVIFGLAYGRGAKAIAFEIKQEGVYITVDEAQAIINAVLEMYPGLTPFFNACKERVHGDHWMCSCFGAFRRFPHTDDRTLNGEFERQAGNFGIQSMVASAMDRAIAYLQDYRDNELLNHDLFKILLQVHDAVLLEVPYAGVDQVVDEVLPLNLTNRVSIFPSDLNGAPTGDGPYHFGIDVEVYGHWGERLTVAECLERGLNPRYAVH